MNQFVQVKKIWQENDRTLGIMWTDDVQTMIDVVKLREKCPCALCVDEWTHEVKIKPGDIPDSTRPIQIQSVGRYALNVQFSDGHSTGIYTFTYLRDNF